MLLINLDARRKLIHFHLQVTSRYNFLFLILYQIKEDDTPNQVIMSLFNKIAQFLIQSSTEKLRYALRQSYLYIHIWFMGVIMDSS